MLVSVALMSRQECQSDRPLVLTNRTGYLASLTSFETGCGSSDSPWSIEAQPGQRINLTLLDFSLDSARRYDPNVGESAARVCRVYATIKEKGSGVNSAEGERAASTTARRSITICGGESRVKTVHVSRDSVVEIRFIHSLSPPHTASFIIKFESEYFSCSFVFDTICLPLISLEL